MKVYVLIKDISNISKGDELRWVSEFNGYVPSCTIDGNQNIIPKNIVENNPDYFKEKENVNVKRESKREEDVSETWNRILKYDRERLKNPQ